MKKLSTLALAGMLATGASSLALVAPAVAQKKEEAAKGPTFKLSKPVQAIANKAQTAIQANDFATAEPLVAQIETAATTDDDKYIAAAMRFDLVNHKLAAASTANPNAPVDQRALAAPLDALIAAKNTPAADRGRFLFKRGQLASIGGQSAVAADYFARAKAAGYSDPELNLQIAQSKIQGGDVTGGLTDLDAEITRREAAGQKAPDAYYRYAISQANQKKMGPETLAWLKKYAAAYPNAKTWYGVVMTYGIQQASVIKPTRTQQIDLFRLMRASGALTDQALYAEYAQRLYDSGNPYEAQTVLKEGLANGKIPAGNAYAKGLLADAATSIRNEGSLATSEKQATAAATGDLSAQTGDAYLGQANYAKAIALYRAALAKPAGKVTKDDINTHLGIALALSGDKAGAAAAFGAVTSPTSAGVASLWSTYVQAGSGPAPAAAAS